MNLVFLYLSGREIAVIAVTGGSEERRLRGNGVRAASTTTAPIYAFARLEPFCLKAERMSEISPLSISIT